MIDYLLARPGCIFSILGLLVLVFFFALIQGCRADVAARERFMEECMKDHKEYECVALWRRGESNTAVVPIPVIIPTR